MAPPCTLARMPLAACRGKTGADRQVRPKAAAGLSSGDEAQSVRGGGRLGPRGGVQLVEDVLDVEPRGSRRDEELAGDLAVGLPEGEVLEDLELARGEAELMGCFWHDRRFRLR